MAYVHPSIVLLAAKVCGICRVRRSSRKLHCWATYRHYGVVLGLSAVGSAISSTNAPLQELIVEAMTDGLGAVPCDGGWRSCALFHPPHAADLVNFCSWQYISFSCKCQLAASLFVFFSLSFVFYPSFHEFLLSCPLFHHVRKEGNRSRARSLCETQLNETNRQWRRGGYPYTALSDDPSWRCTVAPMRVMVAWLAHPANEQAI